MFKQFKKKFKLEGQSNKETQNLLKEATSIENAGAFAIVLECLTSYAAKKITNKIKIPTIGIGSSSYCDGQVLVLHDMLGITTDFSPRFLRRYLDLESQITGAVEQYCEDVRSGDFPNEEESY